MQNFNTADQWVLLKNVGIGYEVDIICSMLEPLSIPVLKKRPGSGDYTELYMGASLTGYNIYVPASRLMEAREIIENIEPIEQDLSGEEAIQSDDHQDGYILRYREVFKKMLVIFFIIPNILGLIYIMLRYLWNLVQ